MTRIKLYKRDNAVGPNPCAPDDEVHGFRLIADGGKLLTCNGEYTYCIDVAASEAGKWAEVNASNA